MDLGRSVDELTPMLRRLLPDNIQLIGKHHPTGLVRADQVALEQIVFNLTTNARDAMRAGGGSFILETGSGW